MADLTSIVLPVHVNPSAPHTIIDAQGNLIAECGAMFSQLDRTGKLLRDAETIAAEIVTVINAHDGLARTLVPALRQIEALVDALKYERVRHRAYTEQSGFIACEACSLPEVSADGYPCRIAQRIDAALAAARGESVEATS